MVYEFWFANWNSNFCLKTFYGYYPLNGWQARFFGIKKKSSKLMSYFSYSFFSYPQVFFSFTLLMFPCSVLIMISTLGSRSNHNKNKWFQQNMHTFMIFMRETSNITLTFMDYNTIFVSSNINSKHHESEKLKRLPHTRHDAWN